MNELEQRAIEHARSECGCNTCPGNTGGCEVNCGMYQTNRDSFQKGAEAVELEQLPKFAVYARGCQDTKQEIAKKVCAWLKENRYQYDQTSDYQFGDMLNQLKKVITNE